METKNNKHFYVTPGVHVILLNSAQNFLTASLGGSLPGVDEEEIEEIY